MGINQLAGTLTIIAVVTCCTFAYRFGKQGDYNKALFFIVLSGLVLRLSSGMFFFLDAWDERYHALVAKNMLAHPFIPTLYDHPALDYDYRSWINNHVWVHKPPVTLWLIAASLKLFGINEIAVRLPSILLSSIGIVFTFYIARFFFDERTALLASFFHAINGLLVELATGRVPTDHVDTIFIFFVELGMFLVVYSMNHPSFLSLLLIGIATGCAILTKSLPGMVVLAVYGVLLLQREFWKKALYQCGIVFFIACIVFIPWQIYIYFTFPQEAAWENYFNTYKHIVEPLEGHDGTVLYQLLMIPRIFGELVFIPILLFFYMFYKKKLNSNVLALIMWFILPYLFFSFVATKMPGYVMISAPAIFIILSKMIMDLNEKTIGSSYRKLIIVLLALLILLPIRYSLERVRPFREIDRNPVWVQELRMLGNKTGNVKAAVFNVEHSIEAMFYANVSAYPFIPNQAQVDEAMRRGFRVFIYDSPSIPFEIKTNVNVVILHHL